MGFTKNQYRTGRLPKKEGGGGGGGAVFEGRLRP